MHQLIAEEVQRGMEQFFCFNDGYPMDIDFKYCSGLQRYWTVIF